MTVTILNPWEQFKIQVIEALHVSSGKDLSQFLEIPTDPQHGDLACTAAFHLAQELKRNPAEIAKEFAVFDPMKFPLIEQVVALGPYINFYLNIIPYRRLVIESIQQLGNQYGKSELLAGKHVVIEYPAVNPNKAWHIGHARNAVLGDTIARLLKIVGCDVTRLDYINDLGLQNAMTYWGLKHLKDVKISGKYDQALGRIYVEAEKEHDEAKVREYLKLMEEGENPVSQEARKMAERTLRAQRKTADRLNISHDLLVWESDIAHTGLFAKALAKIMENPKIKRVRRGKKAGTIIVDLKDYEEFRHLKETSKILVRSDGTATYTGKDIAFHFWKFGIIPDPFLYKPFQGKPGDKDIIWTSTLKGEPEHYRPADIIFNVIGMEQSQQQRTVYTILDTMGYKEASKNYYHLAYEFVTLPDKRFSGRKGTWIGYSTDVVVREATRRARKEVKKRNPEKDTKFYREVAEAIGSAAVRYALLKIAVEKQIIFRWDEVLNFDGNAAPYLMYSYARAAAILKKRTAPEKSPLSLLTTPFETELIKLLGRFPAVLAEIITGMQREKWGTRIELFKLAEYTYALAVAFNSFYNHCPVLRAESEGLSNARLVLVETTRQVLHNALTILGIKPLERI